MFSPKILKQVKTLFEVSFGKNWLIRDRKLPQTLKKKKKALKSVCMYVCVCILYLLTWNSVNQSSEPLLIIHENKIYL